MLMFMNHALQVLLKPIISQLLVEPPASLEEHPNIPSLKDVDQLLVICIGQMAVTAGTDILWKPLNHEVIFRICLPSATFLLILLIGSFGLFECSCMCIVVRCLR